MSAVAVDTSVLLAIFKGEPKGEKWLECLLSAAETAALLISSVVFAEVRSFFPSDDACRKALRGIGIGTFAVGLLAVMRAQFRRLRA